MESQQVEVSPVEQERFEFVKVVLAGTEDVFGAEFARHGKKYEFPVLKIYRARVPTACGTGSAAMGPFHCPGDRKVYIDLSFYDELAQTFNAPGDFAQAYGVAHEVGHHVQTLLETSAQRMRWFNKGLVSGKIEDGDTFTMAYKDR